MKRGIVLLTGVLLFTGIGLATSSASVPRLMVMEMFGATW